MTALPLLVVIADVLPCRSRPPASALTSQQLMIPPELLLASRLRISLPRFSYPEPHGQLTLVLVVPWFPLAYDRLDSD